MALIPVVRIITICEKINIASNIQDRHTIYPGNTMRGKPELMKIFIT